MAEAKKRPDIPKLYWETGLFICFLNRSELDRRRICEDILYNAQDGAVELYTSAWTMAEVVRPSIKSLPKSKPLTTDQINRIERMFEWRWLKKIQVDQRTGLYSAQLSRDYDLRPGDAIHAASAIKAGCNILQSFDPRGSPENRPTTISSKAANGIGPGTRVSYTAPGMVAAMQSKRIFPSRVGNERTSVYHGSVMKNAALPIGQQVILDLVLPPILAALVWLLSRGGANVFEGGSPSQSSLSWLRRSFWFQLVLFYCLVFGITGYAYFFR